jgi:glycosyltransferase involved in cell wall biosynthesis
MVVQTYKTATQSGVTQIAYYYDVPMLVTDVGGLAELVPDEKVGYVVGQDPMQIASALANFYHQNRMEEFRGNIRLEKQRFTWSSMINRLLEAAELQ